MKKIFCTARWLGLILIAIIISLSLTSCDGELGVRGTVYEWINAPVGATSKIYLDSVALGKDIEPTLKRMEEEIPSNILKTALEEVEIAIGPKESIEEKGNDQYLWKTLSDSEGNINDGWIIAPGKAAFLIKASKPGYTEVTGEVEHGNTSNHVILAILVRSRQE